MIKAMEFTLFDGHLPLLQPAEGYRTALDPVLLAAAVNADRLAGAHILDLGCGIGTVGFCLMARFPCKVTGVDLQPELLQLAQKTPPSCRGRMTSHSLKAMCGIYSLKRFLMRL